MFCVFAVYFHKLKLREIEIMQNVLMPAGEMLKLPAQNTAYADECHVLKEQKDVSQPDFEISEIYVKMRFKIKKLKYFTLISERIKCNTFVTDQR